MTSGARLRQFAHAVSRNLGQIVSRNSVNVAYQHLSWQQVDCLTFCVSSTKCTENSLSFSPLDRQHLFGEDFDGTGSTPNLFQLFPVLSLSPKPCLKCAFANQTLAQIVLRIRTFYCSIFSSFISFSLQLT